MHTHRHPRTRWSGYVHKLRRQGFDIESIDERHGGTYAGRHVRYVLRSRVRPVRAANTDTITNTDKDYPAWAA